MPQYIAVAKGSSPYIYGWSWDNATGFGTRFANPSTIPSANTDLVINSDVCILGSSTGSFGAFVYGYPNTGSGWGSVFSGSDVSVAVNSVGLCSGI
jgi:hypothetical protein